jgi:O-antigen ligase
MYKTKDLNLYQQPNPEYLGNPVRQLVHQFNFNILVFLSLHIPLIYLFHQYPQIASLYAYALIGLGLLWLVEGHDEFRVVYLSAYIMGMEAVWRAVNADIFWEFAKYAVSLLLFLALLKKREFGKSDKKPLVYFLLLLPSIFLLPAFDREAISFNLSGPLSLAVATMYFSTVKISRTELRKMIIAFLAPVIGLAFLATFLTFTSPLIDFTGISIKATSANFGPNQVSSILGLGAFLAFVYILIEEKSVFLRILLIPVTVWLLTQAALTFSRGGVWTALITTFIVGFYFMNDRKSRIFILILIAAIALLANYVVLPRIEAFTQGEIETRFASLDLTGRDLIMKSDLLAFEQNPIFGVGPGQSESWHSILFRFSDAHTEYTRLLAEHGIFGLLALLILLTIVLQRIAKKGWRENKGLILAFTAWALIFMVHAAMRLVAPSFMFALASCDFLAPSKNQTSDQSA